MQDNLRTPPAPKQSTIRSADALILAALRKVVHGYAREVHLEVRCERLHTPLLGSGVVHDEQRQIAVKRPASVRPEAHAVIGHEQRIGTRSVRCSQLRHLGHPAGSARADRQALYRARKVANHLHLVLADGAEPRGEVLRQRVDRLGQYLKEPVPAAIIRGKQWAAKTKTAGPAIAYAVLRHHVPNVVAAVDDHAGLCQPSAFRCRVRVGVWTGIIVAVDVDTSARG